MRLLTKKRASAEGVSAVVNKMSRRAGGARVVI